MVIFIAEILLIPDEYFDGARLEGCTWVRFRHVILPRLQPAIIIVIVTSAVGIYNDFVGPLYFLPGNEHVTVQLILFGFLSQFGSQWNLLFADVLVITILPLIMFMFFQRQIVSGMTTGAIKGSEDFHEKFINEGKGNDVR